MAVSTMQLSWVTTVYSLFLVFTMLKIGVNSFGFASSLVRRRLQSHRLDTRMHLNCGIVGLPNVGKSTLFNALVGSEAAQAANFPFCTIGKLKSFFFSLIIG